MRIIAGEYRGRVLKAPKGEGTRPTTDRVREALMSVLSSARDGFEGAVVLDAFAGSGACGFEALSRGASYAEFFERDTAAARVIAGNSEVLGLSLSQARLRTTDVTTALFSSGRPLFDLVFLDPPYAMDPAKIVALIKRLDVSGALADGALVSYEHAKSVDCAAVAALESLQWETVSHKYYGDTSIIVIKKG